MPYPYFNNQNPYINSYGTPYYQQPMQQQPIQQQINQQAVPQQQYVKPVFLQGKVVDSIDVVKASEIPYDYTVSYFPLTDGSAIVTKQLMQDGTSKMIVYKPVEEKEVEKQQPKYITVEEFDETIKKLEKNSNFDDELKKLKRNIEDLQDDVKRIKK